MATESELRDRMRGEEPEVRIDVDGVVRRARSRRRVKELALGGATVLAVVGLAIPAVGSIAAMQSGAGVSSADGPAEEAAPEVFGQPGAGDAPARDLGATSESSPSPDRVVACGAAVPAATSGIGLTLEIVLPDLELGGSAAGVATIANTGTERVTGTTTPSAWTGLAQGGSIVWATESMLAVVETIDLAPGETLDLPVSVTAATCGGVDGVPASQVERGDATVTASIGVAPSDGSAPVTIVSAPEAVEIR